MVRLFLLPRSVKKIAGHVSLAARFCNHCAKKRPASANVLARTIFLRKVILPKKTDFQRFIPETRQTFLGGI